MTTITIIVIVVVALLTTIIFGLAWLGYSSCLKAYKIETEAGKHDEEILKEYHSKKKKSIGGLLGLIGSYVVLTAFAGLFITGIVYKASGENFTINNQTALVIKSGSMSDYYDEKLAEEHPEYRVSQFNVGDICIFETNFDNLVEGEVYGYKYKNIIITHRLIAFDEEHNVCKFRGDNNGSYDRVIPADKIVYHYTGNKIPSIGAFILYAQSYFGIWSLIGIIGITISSEIIYYKIDKINRERDKIICNPEEQLTEEVKEQPKEKKSRKIKANFKRRDGTEVTIYEKGPTAEAPSKTHEEKEGAEDEK